MKNTTPFRQYVLPSLTISLSYIGFCSLYISVSGSIARAVSRSVEHLEQIERVKGFAFILVTGFLLFWCIFILLRMVWKQHSQITDQMRIINDQRSLIVTAERRALSGTFAASIAHDINNVLGFVVYNISELTEMENIPSNILSRVQNIERSFTKIEEMSKKLMEIGRKNVQSSISEFDLSKVVSEMVQMSMMHTRIRTKNVSLHIKNSPVTINSNPFVIEQCILNLLLNSADAIGADPGSIEVHLRSDQKNAIIEVHDSGPGIPQAERDKVFTAFHTTKEHGAGLGLAGVKASLEFLSGGVSIGDSPLGGALMIITVPASFEQVQ